MREILAGDEFRQTVGADPFGAWVQEVLQRVAEWIASLFPSGSGPPIAGEAIAYSVIGIVIALAVIVLVAIGARYWPDAATPTTRVPLEDARAASPEQLMEWASEAEASGDLRAALILSFWAFLKFADRRGLLQYADPKTNWEVLRSRTNNSLGFWGEAELQARKFDAVLYAGDAATREDLDRARRIVGEVTAQGVQA